MPEDKFSFIPKKTFASPVYRRRGLGFLGTISTVLFLVSAFVAGGLWLYRADLQKQITLKEDDLAKTEAGFEVSLINTLINVSEQIEATKKLIANHKTILPIFDFLEKNTLKEVGYKNFKYSLNNNGNPEVVLGGSANGYGVLALQVETFEALRGKDKEIESVSFSDVSVGEKGTVNFNAKLIFNPSVVAYNGK